MDRMHAVGATSLTSEANPVIYAGAAIAASRPLLHTFATEFAIRGPVQQRTSPAQIGATAGKLYERRCGAKEHPVEITGTAIDLTSKRAPIDDPTRF
jgi:hypothetical protein